MLLFVWHHNAQMVVVSVFLFSRSLPPISLFLNTSLFTVKVAFFDSFESVLFKMQVC